MPNSKISSRFSSVGTLLCFGLILSGCQPETILPSKLPASWANATASQFQPPDLMDDLVKWRPHDWRTQLLIGMTDSSDSVRASALTIADSLHPGEPLILIQAGVVAWRLQQWETATQCFLAAETRDPENAWLDLLRARAQALSGDVPKSRTVFSPRRRYSMTNTYVLRLEAILLSLMSDTDRLNPFSLADARSLYEKLQPIPLETCLNSLAEIFLDPLEQRPYDIRQRAPSAALRMAWLGKNLRTESLKGPSVLWSGKVEHDLGLAYEAQAWAFLDLFGRTFRQPALSLIAMENQGQLLNEAEIQLEILPQGPPDPMQIYLNHWQEWLQDEKLKVGFATEESKKQWVWKSALRIQRIP